jgi:formylglycine-generating enzyme required for sulfatase activity
MGGNVSEWTSTRYVSTADDERTLCVAGKPNTDREKVCYVVKGGSWKDPDFLLRAAGRSRSTPEQSYNNIGFRCAKDIGKP